MRAGAAAGEPRVRVTPLGLLLLHPWYLRRPNLIAPSLPNLGLIIPRALFGPHLRGLRLQRQPLIRLAVHLDFASLRINRRDLLRQPFFVRLRPVLHHLVLRVLPLTILIFALEVAVSALTLI